MRSWPSKKGGLHAAVQNFEELAGRQGMTKEQLESAFQTATTNPHGFLLISYDAPPGGIMEWLFKSLLIKEGADR